MRKLSVAGLVITALLGVVVANAAPGPQGQRQGPQGQRQERPGAGPHRGFNGAFTGGTVQSVKRDGAGKLVSFVIKTGDGKTQTITVTSKTQYSAGFNKATSSIVKAKAMVGVQLPKAGVFTADRVMVRGPEQFTGGQVISVKTGSSGALISFVIKRGDGKTQTITVSKSTKYFSGQKASTYKIVKKGANVGVMLPKAGSSQAVTVGVMPPGQFGRGLGGPGPGHRFGAPK